MFGGIIGVFVFYSLGWTGMAAETKQQYTWLSEKVLWYLFNKSLFGTIDLLVSIYYGGQA